MPEPTTSLVIPCFNEADRISSAQVSLLVDAGLLVYLVDDGSTDNTLDVLHEIAAETPDSVRVIPLKRNGGKAAAVQSGMRQAIDEGASQVGYLDGDFATPAEEMIRLVCRFDDLDVDVLLGSRWLHLGARIERYAVRHYSGRVFATLASLLLQLPVYDTQCGAKLFRVTEVLTLALREPFETRWVFDVELLQRLLQGGCETARLYEEPLLRWVDVGGSKMRPGDLPGILRDLFILWRKR